MTSESLKHINIIVIRMYSKRMDACMYTCMYSNRMHVCMYTCMYKFKSGLQFGECTHELHAFSTQTISVDLY